MQTRDSIKTAVKGIIHGKLRSFLTILGIVIGIGSVILLMSIGDSAKQVILGQVQGVGSNLLFAIPGGSGGGRFSAPASSQGIVIKTLVQGDIDSLRREPTIISVAPQVTGQGRAISELNDTQATFIGSNEDFFIVRNFAIDKGYKFTKEDVDSLSQVAVIGPVIAETLFGEMDPIGKTFRIKNTTFRVIGVSEKKGVGPFGIDEDSVIIIPVTVAQKKILGTDHFNLILMQAGDSYDVNFVKERAVSVLRQNHRITDPNKDDFTIRTQQESLELLGSITSILTIFLTAIACISLVVGGIGIMNIMLVSVIERTKEIGLRKAVGATNKDILEQFLWESVILTGIGGVIGIAGGAALTGIIYFVLKNIVKTDWVFSLPPSAIVIALIVSTLTGVVFGIYPAREAARKSPIESLRYE